ncbi:uncharacterized protein LOC132716789, partial [Ruditapes philippinarum]|uniref:uncharacterized protein LOC132716789 n=1 Tax=Ruditapes philippinarum TaxID=129788 RepID=UPI00295B5782
MILTGQDGTGKTFTVKECVKTLRSKGKSVSLTCYTGIACLQYQGLGARTLHKFAGLEDGRLGYKELIDTDERFDDTRAPAFYLSIDEVSMFSCRTLENVEHICRHLKCSHFGGMQYKSGDFYQLPPIKDELYGDRGQYCFEANFFDDMFPHRINLCYAHRQTEAKLRSCVNQLEKGNHSEETKSLMQFLSRPLSPGRKTFCSQHKCGMYNYNRLKENVNPLQILIPDDMGYIHYLNKFIVPERVPQDIPADFRSLLSVWRDNGIISWGLMSEIHFLMVDRNQLNLCSQ